MNGPDKTRKTRRAPRSRPAKTAIKTPATAASLGRGASAVASQRAAAILEVLAGERTPQQAAAALSMSLPYFYLVERKALQGLILACEPQPKGPPAPGPERQIEALEAELARCRRECQRQEALVRATQRAVGLPAPQPPAPKNGDKNGVRRRRRRPVARALRAARIVRENSSGSASTAGLQPLSADERTSLATLCEKETEHVAAPG